MSNITVADIQFTLTWESPFAKHTEIYHLYRVDPSKDKFPLEFKGKSSLPILYRYYPMAIAYEGLNTMPNDYNPFRVLSITDEEIVVDHNHPLAKYHLTITATKVKEYESTDSNKKFLDIGKIITSKGPGMQAPFEFGSTNFFDAYPYKKVVKKDTSVHLDNNAIDQIKSLYSEHIPEHSKVLDLLADYETYLEDDLQTGLLVGIAKNEGILVSNKKLDTYNVQDLEEDIILPYDDNNFDVVICSLSFEYLSDPIELMYEMSRVIKQGGKFIVTFSNHLAMREGIDIWDELHDFERIQLVLEVFRSTDLFKSCKDYF